MASPVFKPRLLPPLQKIRREVPERFRWGGAQCFWCGLPVRYGAVGEADQATREHLKPRAHGGMMGENIVVACRRCNHARSTALDWVPFHVIEAHPQVIHAPRGKAWRRCYLCKGPLCANCSGLRIVLVDFGNLYVARPRRPKWSPSPLNAGLACERKTPYVSWTSAEARAIDIMEHLRVRRSGPSSLFVYRCLHCGHFHLRRRRAANARCWSSFDRSWISAARHIDTYA